MTKILLADDHPIIRTGLTIVIKYIIHDSTIDEAWDGSSVFNKIKNEDYQLIILDVNMTDTNSVDLVQDILTLKPESKILMFSMYAEDTYAKKFLQLGAMGYLSKDAAEPEIRMAINNILNNKRYLSASLIRILAEESLSTKSDNPFNDLTPREFEIFRHIIKGESVKEIGKKLNIHISTVASHKTKIFEKLNCKNIIEMNSLAQVHMVTPL